MSYHEKRELVEEYVFYAMRAAFDDRTAEEHRAYAWGWINAGFEHHIARQVISLSMA